MGFCSSPLDRERVCVCFFFSEINKILQIQNTAESVINCLPTNVAVKVGDVLDATRKHTGHNRENLPLVA